MSIGEFAMGESSVSEQLTSSPTKKTPPKRQIVARADAVTTPEAR